jgi:hypothetical protein
MRWYVVYLLFAQQPREGERSVKYESCQVLIEAPSALIAYDKGCVWAQSHVKDNNFHFLGIEHIHSLDDEQPVDGTEIGGSFFDEEDVWERRGELAPEKSKIAAIMWEQNSDVTIGEMMTEKQKQTLKEIFEEE